MCDDGSPVRQVFVWTHESKRLAMCGGHELISMDFDLPILFNKVGFHAARGC